MPLRLDGREQGDASFLCRRALGWVVTSTAGAVAVILVIFLALTILRGTAPAAEPKHNDQTVVPEKPHAKDGETGAEEGREEEEEVLPIPPVESRLTEARRQEDGRLNAVEDRQLVGVLAVIVGIVGVGVVWKQLAVQTAGTIITLVQDERVRESRGTLYAPPGEGSTDEEKRAWQEAADRVCQAFNAAAYLLKRDYVAQWILRGYVKGTRRAILKSRYLAWPQIQQRRDPVKRGQADLWTEFDWLAKRAWNSSSPKERNDWEIPADRADFGL